MLLRCPDVAVSGSRCGDGIQPASQALLDRRLMIKLYSRQLSVVQKKLAICSVGEVVAIRLDIVSIV